MAETVRAGWPRVNGVVDDRAAEYVERLRALVRLPSVAVRNEGLDACAAYLATQLEALGLAAQVIPTAVCPMVFATSEQRSDRPTLLLTSHYDVQPPEPLNAWDTPPYAAHREGDRIVGRGTTDAKGNLAAILCALDALREVFGDYPLNVKVLFDGAEEQGSPQIDRFFADYGALLAADAVLTFDAGFAPTDHPFVWLGSSGMLNIEIHATGGTKDLHSSRARLAPHAGWRLVHALASIRGADGRVLLDGFYDNVRPPNASEREILASYPWDDAAYQRELGIDAFPDGLTGPAALERLLFMPSCSITGLDSGYTGVGSKEVLPHQAEAKLEFRLAANQTADEIYDKLTAHVARLGIPGIEVRRLASTDPTQSPLDAPIVTALARAAEATYGKPLAIKPRHESSGRQAIWLAQQLGVAGAISGVGPPNWRGHAPNEFMLVPYYVNGIKFIAATIHEFVRATTEQPTGTGRPG